MIFKNVVKKIFKNTSTTYNVTDIGVSRQLVARFGPAKFV